MLFAMLSHWLHAQGLIGLHFFPQVPSSGRARSPQTVMEMFTSAEFFCNEIYLQLRLPTIPQSPPPPQPPQLLHELPQEESDDELPLSLDDVCTATSETIAGINIDEPCMA